MNYNSVMKRFLLFLLIIFTFCGITCSEEIFTDEVDLKSPMLKINTQTREDMINSHGPEVTKIKQTN